MTSLLLRSGKDPFTPIEPEACLVQNILGSNSGNALFGNAVHKTLSVPGVELVSNSFLTERSGVDDAYADRINERFDGFVVPLANAFRPGFTVHLDRLSDVIERLDIPVIVVGVGAQLDLDGTGESTDDAVIASTKRFMAAVLDRSASVGVRGEFTRRYLAGLGFGDEHVDVIGCPSLFQYGAGPQVVKRVERIEPDSAIALNISPDAEGIAGIVERHAAAYPNMTYVAQENYTLTMLLWGEDARGIRDKRLPEHTGHQLYREGRIRLFVDTYPWEQFLAGQAFAFGTRIHGNVAALRAGTPAVQLAWDSRTLELAEYHRIPHRLVTDMGEDVDAAQLYDDADFTEFNTAHAGGLATFLAFLEKNGLSHIYQSGKSNVSYDDDLTAVEFPPAVLPVTADGEVGRREVMRRLRWLRQGIGVDRARGVYQHKPPVPHTAPAKATPVRDEVAHLRSENAALREQVDAMDAARTALAQRLETIERSLASVERERVAESSELAELSRSVSALQRAPAVRLGRAMRSPVRTIKRRADRSARDEHDDSST